MLKENKPIDKLFADKFKDLSVEPRPEVWDKIKGSMNLAQRRKRKAIIFTSLAAVASIALLFSLSTHFFFPDEIMNQDSQLLSRIDTNSNQAVADSKTETEILLVEGEELKIVGGTENVESASSQEVVAAASLFKSGLTSKPKSRRNEKLSVEPIQSKVEVLESRLLAMQFPKEKSTIEKASPATSNDSLIIVEDITPSGLFEEAEKGKKEWSVLGQVSSAYSSYTGTKSENSSESGLVSFGGGLRLNWQASKKIALQMGLVYSKFGQQLTQASPIFASPIFDASMMMGNSPNRGMETSAGHVKLKESAVLHGEPDFFFTRANTSSLALIQSFEAIEIPLILRYDLIDKRVGLCVNGGLSTNLMVGNSVYDEKTGEILGETVGIRTTNFSTHFSLGVEYKLNAKFSLSLEPSLKYYLNSINKSPDFNYKPYLVGFNSGVRYNF